MSPYRVEAEVPLERLTLESMAIGWQSLLLTERVGWEEFPRYAGALVRLLGARMGRPVDGPDVRLLPIRVHGNRYWLVFDDLPFGVSLEPRSPSAARHIGDLKKELERARR